MTFNIQGSKI